MNVLRTAGKAMATLLPASQLARLGLPALWSADALAVLVLIGAAWVVIDNSRAKNLALILSARRGRDQGSIAEPPCSDRPRRR